MSFARTFALAAAALALFATPSQAVFLTGSSGLSLNNITTNPTASSVQEATSFTFNGGTLGGLTVNNNRNGSYLTELSTNQSGSASTLQFNGTAVGSTITAPFTLTFATSPSDTFTASSGFIFSRQNGEFSSLTVNLSGIANFAGFDPTPTLLTIQISQTGGPGNSIDASGTINSPLVTAVPAPAGLFVAALGLMSLAGFRGLRVLKA